MKWIKIENYTTSQLLLLVAIIILVVPPLLTLPAFCDLFNFSTTGQIGDTIGGLTAPFLNGLTAVLVFIAFKEQINANEIFKNQEKSRNILDQITLVQEDKLKIEEIIVALIRRETFLIQQDTIEIIVAINKVIYFLSELRLATELIEEYKGERDFLYRKLYYLYVIRYKDLFSKLETNIKQQRVVLQNFETYKIEMLSEILYLNRNFENVNKYRTHNPTNEQQ
jgi:hypothetical protein